MKQHPVFKDINFSRLEVHLLAAPFCPDVSGTGSQEHQSQCAGQSRSRATWDFFLGVTPSSHSHCSPSPGPSGTLHEELGPQPHAAARAHRHPHLLCSQHSSCTQPLTPGHMPDAWLIEIFIYLKNLQREREIFCLLACSPNSRDG